MATMNGQRWYDQQPETAQAVNSILSLQPSVQQLVAEELAFLAEQEFQIMELMNQLKTLGVEKVLALYKSKNRLRAYDKNPAMHKAMNYLSLLNQRGDYRHGRKVVQLAMILLDYINHCQPLEYTPQAPEVRAITRVFADKGPPQSELLAQSLKDAVTQKTAALSPTRISQDNREDMQIQVEKKQSL